LSAALAWCLFACRCVALVHSQQFKASC
jgi:hypothetical protein